MKRCRLLEICARIDGHPVQHQMLRQECENFNGWQELLELSEREGMTPLLHKHLAEAGVEIPPAIRRSLHLLTLRHQQQANVRLQFLGQLIDILDRHKLRPILVKGIALCQTLYPDPSLRPMRDIDLLFHPEEAGKAQELLLDEGFEQSDAPISPDHHHLPALQKNIDGVLICLELHGKLYPDCPPAPENPDFDQLIRTGKIIDVGKGRAYILGWEEMLVHIYQHAFRSPLSYETYKLINAADLIGFTERYFQEINWDKVPKGLCRALPLMHHISPWDTEKAANTFLAEKAQQKPLPPLPFRGWPQRRMKMMGRDKPLKILKESLLPPEWWLRVHYGTGYSLPRFLWARYIKHPATVIWWIRLMSYYLPEAEKGEKRLPLSAGFYRLWLIIKKLLRIN